MPRKDRAALILPLPGEKTLRSRSKSSRGACRAGAAAQGRKLLRQKQIASQPYEAVRFGKVRS